MTFTLPGPGPELDKNVSLNIYNIYRHGHGVPPGPGRHRRSKSQERARDLTFMGYNLAFAACHQDAFRLRRRNSSLENLNQIFARVGKKLSKNIIAKIILFRTRLRTNQRRTESLSFTTKRRKEDGRPRSQSQRGKVGR